MLKSEGHAERVLPFIGPDMAGSASCGRASTPTTTQEKWPQHSCGRTGPIVTGELALPLSGDCPSGLD